MAVLLKIAEQLLDVMINTKNETWFMDASRHFQQLFSYF
jgi:hypothetical protein